MCALDAVGDSIRQASPKGAWFLHPMTNAAIAVRLSAEAREALGAYLHKSAGCRPHGMRRKRCSARCRTTPS